jgi:hypothetical protein
VRNIPNRTGKSTSKLPTYNTQQSAISNQQSATSNQQPATSNHHNNQSTKILLTRQSKESKTLGKTQIKPVHGHGLSSPTIARQNQQSAS